MSETENRKKNPSFIYSDDYFQIVGAGGGGQGGGISFPAPVPKMTARRKPCQVL